MSCKKDVEVAILNKVLDELTKGRYTFTRISDDTIQVNGRQDTQQTKVTSRSQARAIANELLERTKKSFNNQVTGYITESSQYDPLTVTFRVNDTYISHIYNNLPNHQQTEGLDRFEAERDMVNNNTGFNSERQLTSFSPGTYDKGVYTKYINFKQSLLNSYHDKLNKIKLLKNKKGVTADELTKLKKVERQLTLAIEGSHELKIKGLKDEIKELEKNAETLAVGYYVEKDLNRLEALSNSNDVDDLAEAQRIIDFYTLAGTFQRGVENPFFSQEEIFLKDEYGKLSTEFRRSPETRKQYEDWKNRATSYINTVNKKKEEFTTEVVNSNSAIKNTYKDRVFSFDELTNKSLGLRDTDWVSMWTMDITNGIFSNNGVLPQVMFSYLTNSFEGKLAWAREIEEKIDKLNPEVQKELIKLGHSIGGLGILGLKGASYNLFKEISKEGNETNSIVQRFTKEYFDAEDRTRDNFQGAFDNAKLIDDFTVSVSAFNKAFEEHKKWKRNNSIILDITKLSEIITDKEFTFGGKEDIAYKQSLIDLLGQKGYDEQIESQKKNLRNYISNRQAFIDSMLILNGKNEGDSLSDNEQANLELWEHNHSPVYGIEDYNSASGIYFANKKINSYMKFNSFIARKNKVVVTANQVTGKYEFTDTEKPTGNYNDRFATIENNPVLSQFYDLVKEVSDNIRESVPYELQKKIELNTLPGLIKTTAEIMADSNTGVLSRISIAFRHMMDRFRTGFGIVKQAEISYASLDPITGRANYSVNDGFLQGNSRSIQERNTIEQTKFLQAWNSSIKVVEAKLQKIKRFTTLPLSRFNESSLILLAQYIHADISLADIKAGRLDAIRAKTGDAVEIGRIIRDFSLHSVVQTQTFDLAKLSKYFANMTMMYAARQEALPILEIMKKHYEGIQKPDTNNLNKQIINAHTGEYMKVGVRTHAMRQMDNWFERVVLDNYGGKHRGEFGRETVGDKIPIVGRTIYTTEEKKKLKEIQKLIDKTTNETERNKLQDIQKGLGKTRVATAFLDNLLAWTRTLRLGYNLSSATTNFLEGVTSNVILAASGDYFDSKELYYGYHVTKLSFVKNVTFGRAAPSAATKNRSLMDKFNVIMDSKNELQKSSHKTYASKLSWLNPHELNQRVEYINQSPIMIAMLRTMKIEDKSGKEDTLWNAYDKYGHLKEEFKTEKNTSNWENLSGQEYLNFKQKLHKVIVLGHGNYDELRGMMAKSNVAGKALMMFKTWLPQQFYWRFASEQDDIQTGTIGYKGRYFSYGKGTALVHGALVGTLALGFPIGLAVGGGLGLAFGLAKGTDSGVGLLRETLLATKQLFLKCIGMPVNLIAGKKLISDGTEAFESWVGKGNFTERDAKNMRANMADLSMQLAWLGLIILTKSIFWDDDDKPEDDERRLHNIAVNKLMQLSSQAAMYVNPKATWKNTLGSMAVEQYLEDATAWVESIAKLVDGKDIIPTGINAGESNFYNQSRKVFLPGMFKDGNPLISVAKGEFPLLGFQSQADRVFTESFVHEYFKSDEKRDKEDNTRDRSERRKELHDTNAFSDIKDEKEREKAIEKEIDKELPTPTKLKKLNVTREEYEEQNK